MGLIELLWLVLSVTAVPPGHACCSTPIITTPNDPVATVNHGNDSSDTSDDKADDDKDGDDKDEDKWDVNAPSPESSEVALDTTTGTWLDLDVSPDGSQIVFSLLGDLYTVGIAGGDATALTSGRAWDMQPTFSPDGSHIAYTSDAGGGDNIWTIKRDGSEATQVTKEKFRLLNSPAWSPDGDYIIARKHFTSRRSIGAGEIWIYHRTGGEGLQMTKRPNEQKDLGEPAFSPDGRYVYYSQDVTPGKSFQYNKDPNTEIYAIQRLDRQTGETIKFVHGPGGAIRPTPSPDGELLAFARRVRNKTVLFLQEIASGREWPIYDGLERDMQETWAIHGVYSRFAWTPDGHSLVFWAKGKIWRIDIQSKAVREIPFRVRSTRTITKALRFPVEVAPDTFQPKMLRWVQVSPKGDKVVFQTLGHLYIRNLPDGTPRRLTTQTDHFEHYPSFSRDGKWIVYTTWNDETLGSVRIVSADGGVGRKITDKPYHCIEPVFTPDGKEVVCRRVGGGWLRSELWSREPGIYRVPTEGGESTLITKKGRLPHFGADSDRVFLLRVESKPDKDRRTLDSIELDGSDERTHLVSENATEFRVSPDGKWVAFTERFNAYITPFIPTGKEVNVGPKSKAIPLKKVSRDAGQFLHWSGDSRKLHWALGPELFTRDVSEAFAFIPGAPDELPDPPEAGVNISFKTAADIPTGSVAIVGARIVTMRGDEVIEDGTVLVNRNRIVAVGPRSTVSVPSDAYVIDGKGKTVTPGWVDVHDHGAHGTNGIIPQQNWSRQAMLAFGVTTTHDPSNDTNTVFASSEMAKAGLIVEPRAFSTGTILYGAAGSFKAEIDSLEDAESHLRRLKAVGAFSVKSYNQPRRDQRQQVIAAARELKMMVVPEGGSLFQHNMTMVADGHTGIEHCLPVANIYDDVTQFWSGSATYYTPTLMVAYGGQRGEDYFYEHDDVWANERLAAFVPRFVIDPRSRRRVKLPPEEYNHFRAAAICKKLVDVGVGVNLGAHGQLPGLGPHWEVWMFVQGGMTPMEALRSATLTPAKYLGFDGDIGSIETGKLADMVVLSDNPLANIRNTEHIDLVIQNGRVYDARTLNQVGNHPSIREAYFWE